MTLQKREILSTVGMGILGDVPPNCVQPPLADDIHLRWAFERELGFPRYGCYLFRRLAGEVDSNLYYPSYVLGELPVGRWPFSDLSPPFSRASSDGRLVLTDDFAPSGRGKIDLDGRSHSRFDLRESARRVWMFAGFCEETEIEMSVLLGQIPLPILPYRADADEISPSPMWSDAISALGFIKQVAERPNRGHTNIRVKWDRRAKVYAASGTDATGRAKRCVLDNRSTRAG